ncbi:MAG: right-handed parallel beta-helix repeat-containing protein [Verrucomicrobiota bacterium]
MKSLFCFLLFTSLTVTRSEAADNLSISPSVLQSNSPAFINVTQADGVYVREPITATAAVEPAIARRNSLRMKAIMTSTNTGPKCLIYFPPGQYCFDGAAPEWQASIETTHSHQTIAGADLNATRILQLNREVASTVRLRHTGSTVRDLFIGASDYDTTFHPEWEQQPLKTAIFLDAAASEAGRWSADPVVRKVNINSPGNTIERKSFYRPFRTGLEVKGAWLNVYAHTLWITDTFTAIDIDQGPVMAGPAKFIDINHYCIEARGQSKAWTTFFRSTGHFMEQVELIHCTFIGAQFIRMDGRPATNSAGNSPAYDMIIDHNYINVYDTMEAPEAQLPDKVYSGIYLNLPPLVASGPRKNYSRDIRFTNNSCTGRAPGRGAFFYAEGNCRGITFSENDISCAGADKCIYIRPGEPVASSDPLAQSDVAIRDVKITRNYFRNWRAPITLGGDRNDPARSELAEKNIARGCDDDAAFIQRVIIADNQSMQEESVTRIGLTHAYLNRCRQVSISGNTFDETVGWGLAAQDCEDVSITGNTLRGLQKNNRTGIVLQGVKTGTVTGNIVNCFANGITVTRSEGIALSANSISGDRCAIECRDTGGVSLTGNTIAASQTGLSFRGATSATLAGNLVQAETNQVQEADVRILNR